ncbi:DUF1566 domain-containing protein, partial [Flavobacteriales bacterium]|nr:DUF1566 domain-containing protein [Flavobacteriales bacterium]
DELANNYNVEATVDDESCTYAPVIFFTPPPVEFTNGETLPLASSQDLWDLGLIYDADNSLEELTITLSVNPDKINLVWDGGINSNPTVSAVSDFSGSTEIELCISDAISSVCASNIIIVYEGSSTEDDTAVNYLDLPEGWSMFGYTCIDSVDAMVGFSEISDKIEIIKDELGLAYLPAWGFSAFDNLEFGEGYQIKMIEEVTDFQFCEAIVPEDGVSQADVDAAYAYGAASVDITSDNQVAFDEGAASVTPEDGISQADVDAAFDEGAASVTPEDGITQEDVDAAIAEVHAMYEGWCESDIDNDGICDGDEVLGCDNPDACGDSFNPLATENDGSCLFFDDCGVCDGDNDCELQIGDQHEGGIVFQINEDGSGLVADISDLGQMDWYSLMDAAGNATSQGYSDWYLPNDIELTLMWNTIGQGSDNAGGFEDYFYWSSSQTHPIFALYVNFINGNTYNHDKANSYRGRVIRAF